MRALLFALAFLGVGCAETPGVSRGSPPAGASDSTAAPATPNPLGHFGYVDSSGTQLLAIGTIEAPTGIVGAVCADGHVFPVRHDRKQARRRGDTGRQTAANFDNEAGDVFRFTAGPAQRDGTCYLSADSTLLARAVGVRPVEVEECPRATSSRIAVARSRQVIHCWHLAEGPGAQLAAVQFVTVDSSALASIVVDRGGPMMFHDLPAVYRGPGEDLWRVEDGGVFSPADLHILFVAELPGGYMMATTWAGAEGESEQLLAADTTGNLRTLVTDYRYWVGL